MQQLPAKKADIAQVTLKQSLIQQIESVRTGKRRKGPSALTDPPHTKQKEALVRLPQKTWIGSG